MKNWLIGFAENKITPKHQNISMTGYDMERIGSGVLTELLTQVIVFRGADQKVPHVLIAADILVFDVILVEKIRLELFRKYRIPSKNIICSASHTHWGPAVSLSLNPLFRQVNAKYLKWLVETILKTVDQAIRNSKEGKILFTKTKAQIGANRRVKTSQGIKMAINEHGYYDQDTPIFLIERKGSPSPIILVGHACHPTSTGKHIQKWSADYPGYLRDFLRKKLGPKSRVVFFMGAGADAKVTSTDSKSKAKIFSNSPGECKKAGEALGRLILEVIKKGELENILPKIRSALVRSSLSLQKPFSFKEIQNIALGKNCFENYMSWWAQNKICYPDLRKKMDYSAQAWQFNNQLTLLALEGELCSPLGPLARSVGKTPQIALMAYANATCGYIPTKKILIEGGYEAKDSFMVYNLPAPFSHKVEKEFMQTIKKVVNQLS